MYAGSNIFKRKWVHTSSKSSSGDFKPAEKYLGKPSGRITMKNKRY